MWIASSPNLTLKGTWERGVLVSTTFTPSNGFHCDDDPELIRFAKAYASGAHLGLTLSLSHLTPFTRRVLYHLQDLPFGQTLTYAELAVQIGSPKAARAVGTACGRNPFPLLIPCHRVVGSSGLGGFSCGLKHKQALLSFESKLN